MHCASCASIITRKLKKLPGIQDVSVNVGTEAATITYDPGQISVGQMNKEIGKLGYTLMEVGREENTHVMPDGTVMGSSQHAEHVGLHQTKAAKLTELASQKRNVLFTLPFSILMFALTLWDLGVAAFSGVPKNPVPMEILNPLLLLIATPILLFPGRIFLEGVIRFIKYRVANMDTLVGIGTLAAYVYSAFVTLFPVNASRLGFPINTYFDVTIVIIGFILFGKYLEARSKLKTGEAIEFQSSTSSSGISSLFILEKKFPSMGSLFLVALQ